MKPIRVSQVNNYIKRILSSDPILSNVSVVGEISNIVYNNNGHVYFSLKDEDAKINCFLPRDVYSRSRFELDNGLSIIADGYLNVYVKGGTYSFNIRKIDVQGSGDLSIAFEKLKSRLQAEGLFDEMYKKAIPEYPRRIAIVTSETGAAIQDIFKTIKAKNSYTSAILYAVRVQGEYAAGEIAEAIDTINAENDDIETIIVGRGGGSLEELWAFNEEAVARSIFRSKIPVISAVGHESDYTICDFVADFRAATPTAAAGIAVPDSAMMRDSIEYGRTQLINTMDKRLQGYENKIRRAELESMKKTLLHRLSLHRLKLHGILDNNYRLVNKKVTALSNEAREHYIRLEALNPRSIMSRGYAAFVDDDGRLIRGVDDVEKGDRVTGIMMDGKAELLVEGVTKNEV